MNLLKLTLLLLSVTFIASCGDDDEGEITCLQMDWVGVYSGTQDCNDGNPQDVTLTISASGTDAINFSYTITDSSGTTTVSSADPIPLDNCSASFSGTDQGITVSIEASLDGDDITFTDILSAGTISESCTITATRN